MPLKEGDIPYALTHEQFKSFDQELMLHDFHEGNPTYTPDLKLICTFKMQYKH